MDMSVGIISTTYTCKVDNHILEIELNNKGKNNYVRSWWNYNNNMSSGAIYYDVEMDILYANVTKRQAKMITAKIKYAIEMQKKCMEVA